MTEKAYYPEWYPLFVAAKYLGCKPWELMEVSVWWRDRALTAMTAESQAQEFLSKRKQ